jgi:cysteine sulfinate desulfinase/cysteine desulfurase-like protein/rhodanese-related sulfurtransferase
MFDIDYCFFPSKNQISMFPIKGYLQLPALVRLPTIRCNMIHLRSTEVYLDSNATTPVMEESMQAARLAMEDTFGNPSSSHTTGLRARSLMENARDMAKSVLGAGDGTVVFTSGATEAIQMAIFSTLCHVRDNRQNNPAEPRLLLYGATEHKAVPQALAHWNDVLQVGDQVVEIPVDANGLLDLEFIREHAAQADMICTMAVNNESGVIHDLKKVETAIRGENGDQNPELLWLVDCVQAVGKMPLNLKETTIDYAAVSGHKIYAPKGIGLLYSRKGKPLKALLAGGGQESGARGGTENLPGVAAIAAVLEKLDASPSKTFAEPETLKRHQEKIVAALSEAFPEIVFNTPFDHSVPTTVNFAVDRFENKELLDLFDAAGVRVSSGSACGSGAAKSYVLDAMGVPEWRSRGAIRLSFGPLDTESQIDSACRKIISAGQALSDSCLMTSVKNGDSTRILDGLIQLKKGSDCTWIYLDSKTGTGIVIDPFAAMLDRVESLLRCQHSRVIAVLDTHAHVDHDSPRPQFIETIADCLADSANSRDPLGWPDDSELLTLSDGSTADYLPLGEDKVLARFELPGHTTESFAYLIGTLDGSGNLPSQNIEFAFTGDTILFGGIGRTDFASSTPEGMFQSLKSLPGRIDVNSTVICPTHDYSNVFATTLATEIKSNSFLARILDHENPMSRDEFLAEKPGIDQQITDATNCELVCGFMEAEATTGSPVELALKGINELKEHFAANKDAIVIDVRESHEFTFAQNWSDLGLSKPPRNIPLSQLTNALPELMQLDSEDNSILFLCRSGRRSQVAAKLALRIGMKNITHIRGGLALNSSPPNYEMEFVI